jgi:hypothetical protein
MASKWHISFLAIYMTRPGRSYSVRWSRSVSISNTECNVPGPQLNRIGYCPSHWILRNLHSQRLSYTYGQRILVLAGRKITHVPFRRPQCQPTTAFAGDRRIEQFYQLSLLNNEWMEMNVAIKLLLPPHHPHSTIYRSIDMVRLPLIQWQARQFFI